MTGCVEVYPRDSLHRKGFINMHASWHARYLQRQWGWLLSWVAQSEVSGIHFISKVSERDNHMFHLTLLPKRPEAQGKHPSLI